MNCPRNHRRGAAAVELAVLLPTLLVIVLGCVDFGRISSVSIALNNAVGSGGAFAASHRFTEETQSDWEDRIRDVVTEELQPLSAFAAGSLTIGITINVDADESRHVTIDASYPFQTVVDWPGVPHLTVLNQRLTVTNYR